MQGQTINGFELKRLLGKGGMAEVWYAENEIGKPAAVKILSANLSDNQQIVERFHNEALVMVKLDHPNIRQVYGYGYIGNRHCIVMEYLEGDDLEAMLKAGRRFTDEELRRWWNQTVDALNYTHAMGIVHRDIKPSNLFLDKRGNIKLLDFGIAKVKESISMTRTGALMGTLMYMSPEQVKDTKNIDYRTDIYSLAVTFAQLVSGNTPYDTDSSGDFEIREQIVYQTLDLTSLPEGWRGFLAPYLEKDPEKRPALRHFEATAYTPATEVPHQGNQTIASNSTMGRTQTNNNPSHQVQNNGPDPQTSTPDDKPKSKKGLWIGLGIAAAAVLALLVLLLLPKKTERVMEPEQPVAQVPAAKDGLTITVNGVSFVMKEVEGGTFQMGSDNSAYQWERPVHSVTVSSFYMGETEVTQGLWKAVTGNNNSRFIGDELPMDRLSYNDIVYDFLPKLNQLTGKNFRLPTEAEWEFAARGGNRNSGNTYAGSYDVDKVAWYWQNTGDSYLSGNDETWDWNKIVNNNGRTRNVKGKAPNELGLYDMSGNVWEWCSDEWYSYTNAPQTNPRHDGNSESSRVMRGGSWCSRTRDCLVSYRSQKKPDEHYDKWGCRLALDK